MDEIKKKLQEIRNWADAKDRNAFIMVSEGREQLILTNTSIRNLTAMLAAAMCNEKYIAQAVREAIAKCSAQS